MSIRVFVVDDHTLVRAGVRAEIGSAVDIVGEAATVAAAVDGIEKLLPDIVLLDVHLPDGGGRAVLAAITPVHPRIRFLALSV
ncbi:MAG: response regulator, partial [Kibdelosporangium sp.]